MLNLKIPNIQDIWDAMKRQHTIIIGIEMNPSQNRENIFNKIIDFQYQIIRRETHNNPT